MPRENHCNKFKMFTHTHSHRVVSNYATLNA